jgi:APA family basic amino acid/polyamine antiporter
MDRNPLNPPAKFQPHSPAELIRAMGLLDCTLLVIGAIIGSGIFLTPSSVARETQSVSGILCVWILGGLLSLSGAMTFAELGATYPKAGGIYVFLREAYGAPLAFLYGWCVFFVINSGSIATLGSAFAIYIGYLLPVSPGLGKAIAVVSIGLLTLINCLGVQPGVWVQNLFTVVKIGSLIGIAGVLFASANPGLHVLRQVSHSPHPLPWVGYGIAMIGVLWTYHGWHLLTFAAGEVKSPTRNLTGGLFLGTLASMALYLAVNLGYLTVLPFDMLKSSPRVASDAMERAVGPWGGTAVAVAILISIVGAMNSNILGGPRVLYAMAHEGLFFRSAALVHPRFRVPWVSILLGSAWAAILTFVGSFERLFNYVIFVAWIFYALGAAGAIVLRRKHPELPRPYKVWGYPWMPILFIVVSFLIVLNVIINDFKNSSWGLLVVLTGLPAYLYWNKKRKANSGATFS